MWQPFRDVFEVDHIPIRDREQRLAKLFLGDKPLIYDASAYKALLALPDDPLLDHATDALAVAVCHANHAPALSALAAAR